ncbi:hypothetical protein LTR56_001526 [Elasticomyces elasticus]|nr:hypothetical protein LTR56_001526 [Elasticomyces elasticus]KAK3668552.1 hypothetical protein LTR22_000439 [Elasticomyces elasticus]KAK4931904.1 hypothetical protein LTR49_001591 [Elasticomyces elasticus]KAK5768565.1 hypothetical protein LTS12_001353 [Elasticomyces elasticus]
MAADLPERLPVQRLLRLKTSLAVYTLFDDYLAKMLRFPEQLRTRAELDSQQPRLHPNPLTPKVDWSDSPAVKNLMVAVEANALAQLGPPESSLQEFVQLIPIRDGSQSAIKIHRPAPKPSGGSPLIVPLHGGGFVAGSKDQLTGSARGFCSEQ